MSGVIITTSSVCALLVGAAAEQVAEDRDVADAGNLRHRRGHGVVHQAGDGERLAVLQLDFGLGAARRERRHAEAGAATALAKSSELTSGLTLRLIRSPPSTVGVKVRRTPNSLNTIVTELLLPPCDDRIRILAAGEEAGFLAVGGDQVRLGQALEQPLRLERLHHRADVVLGVEQEHVQEVAERQAAALPRIEVGRGELLRRGAAEPVVLVAVGDERGAELLQRVAAHLGEADAQHHLVRGDALLLLQQVDDVLLLLDEAGGDVGRLVDRYLLETVPEMTTSLPLPVTLIASPGRAASSARRGASVAADVHFVGLDAAGAVPDEQGDRARRLAVNQQLAAARSPSRRRRRARSARRARSRADVEDGDRPDEQVDAVGCSWPPADRRRSRRASRGARPGCCACGVATRITMMYDQRGDACDGSSCWDCLLLSREF